MNDILLILDRQERVIGVLKNTVNTSAAPFFDDVFHQNVTTGAETFSFSALASSPQARDLVIGNYIAFRNGKDFKLFQIIETSEYHKESLYIDVYCECAGLDLITNAFRKRKLVSCSLKNFLTQALENTGWKVGALDYLSSQLTVDLDLENDSVYSILQNNISKYNCEISFRVVIKQGKIVQKFIDTYNNRGKITGKRFEFGRNIEGIKRVTSGTSLFTALIGIGKNGLNFSNVTVEGIDKPLGQDFVADQKAFDKYNHKGNHLMGFFEYDTESPEELLRETYKKLQDLKQPQVTYDVEIALVKGSEDLEIGDMIAIVDNSFNPAIHLMARVVDLYTSKTNPDSNKCVISNFIEVKSNITAEMRKIAQELENAVDNKVDSKFPIGGEDIKDGAINSDHIYENSITTDHLIAEAITAEKIQSDAIKTKHIDAEQIEAKHIKSGTITADKITSDEFITNSAQIKDGIIGTAQIGDAEITVAKIQDLFVDDLVANQGKFQSAHIGVLTSDNIDADTIKAEHITASVIDAINLNVEGKISAERIDVDSLTVDEIDAGKITTGDLNADRIKASVISAVNLSAEEATINSAKIGNLTADKISGSVIEAINLSVSGKISADKIDVDSITVNEIDAGKITSGYLSSDRIKAGTITAEKINSEAISTIELGASSIVADKISSGEIKVTDANIIDGTISGAKITKASIGNAQIEEAFIADAYVKNITADKIKGGTLDAKNITVKNLSADSITVGKINGQQIASGAIGSDNLDELLSGTIKNTVDNVDKALTDIGLIRKDVENIEIGGRNLVSIKTVGVYKGGRTNIGNLNNIKISNYKIATTGNPSDLIGVVANNITSKTLSITGFSDLATVNIYYAFKDDSNTIIGSQLNKVVKTANKKFTTIISVPTGATNLNIGFGQFPYVNNYYIENIMIVNGNKPTDWTPAPEDVEANINNLEDTINGTFKDGLLSESEKKSIRQSLNIIKGDMTEADKIYETLNKNSNLIGTPKTNLYEGKMSYNNAYNSLVSFINTALSASIVTDSQVNSIQSAFGTYRTTLGVFNTRVQEAIDSINSKKVDDVEIGGRNLIIKDNLSIGWVQSNGTISSDSSYRATEYIQCSPGETFIFQVWTPSTVQIWYDDTYFDENKTYISSYNSNYRTTNHLCEKLIVPENAKHIRISFSYNVNYKYKLEKGNKATDWTPAPEDVDSAINSVTEIANGKNTIIYSASQPATTGRKVNDIWYNTSDGYKMYYFNGSSWVLAQFGTNAISAGAITADKIATNAITAGKISAGAVTTEKLYSLSVTADKIATNAITAGKISANAISAGNISASAITTDKIATSAITADKLDVDNLFVGENAFIKSLKAVEIDASNITTGKISGERIDISGLVSFEALDETLNGVFKPVYNSNGVVEKTYINGGMISTGTVSADKIDIYSGLSVQKNGVTTFAISQDGSVQMDGLLQSSNFDSERNLGYQISPEGTAIFNQAKIKGDIELPNAGITNYGGGKGDNIFRNSNFALVESVSNYTWDKTLNGDKLPNYWNGFNSGVTEATKGYHAHYDNNTFGFGTMTFFNLNSKYGQKNRWMATTQAIYASVYKFKANTKYTFSVDIFCDTAGFIVDGGLYHKITGATSSAFNSGKYSFKIKEDERNRWIRKSWTFTTHENTEGTDCSWYVYGHNGAEGKCWIKNLKLEEGDIANDWSVESSLLGKNVRFWAGATYQNRDVAPFRVQQDGSLFANNGTFSGTMYGQIENENLHISNGTLTISNETKTLMDDGSILSLQPRALSENVKLSSNECIFDTDIKVGGGKIAYSKGSNRLNIKGTALSVEGNQADVTFNTESGAYGGLNIIGCSQGHHILRGSTASDKLGTLVIDAEGNQGQRGDFSFTRKNYAEKCKVDIDGDLSINEKITSQIQKIEMRSVKNSTWEGWGFYAT